MMDFPKSLRAVRRLTKGVALALSILAVLLVLSQALLQYIILNQEDDSRVVNIAGRQRTLSQIINKSAFGLYLSADETDHQRYLYELEQTLALWQQSHQGLRYGDEVLGLPGDNSPQILTMLSALEPQYEAITGAATEIKRIAAKPSFQREDLLRALQVIKNNEPKFLRGMDAIVFQYDRESQQKIKDIRFLQILILLVVFIILSLEVLFIFRPALRSVKRTMEELESKEEAMKKEKELFSATLLSIDEGIIAADTSERIIFMNTTAEKYTGWTNEEARGRIFDTVFNNINLITGEKGRNPVRLAMNSTVSIPSLKHIGLRSKSGEKIFIAGTTSRIITADGAVNGVVVAFRNITKEYVQEAEITAFLEVNLDMLCVIDAEGNFLKVNKKFEEVLGYPAQELAERSFLSLIHEEDLPETTNLIQEAQKTKAILGFTNRYGAKDGTYRYIEWSIQYSFDQYLYASARDVTDKQKQYERMKNLATSDELTGLYNRHFLESIIENVMLQSDADNEPLSLLLMDLDHFKRVNDIWGHPVGDDVLRAVAQNVTKVIRASDYLIRYGGEEFLLLMAKTSNQGAIIVAEKIGKVIEQNNHPVAGRQTVSIGVAERIPSESFAEWYRRVDDALYHAKHNGRNCIVASEKPASSGRSSGV